MKIKHIAIVGCGRLGSSLANDLSADGHRIMVIDHRERTFDKLSASFSGFKIVGNTSSGKVQLYQPKSIIKPPSIGGFLFSKAMYETSKSHHRGS